MGYTVPHILAGAPRLEPSAGNRHAITNPATGEVIGEVPFASSALCAETVENARKAFPEWAATPPIRRARILNRFRELLERRGFTAQDPSVPEEWRGTYRGAAEKAEYLASLGITAIELLPIHETQNDQNDLREGSDGDNYWGYASWSAMSKAAVRRSPCWVVTRVSWEPPRP